MVSLQANELLSSTGLILGNRGFVLTREESESLKSANADCARLIFPLRNGDDINGKGRDAYVIDTNGWSDDDLSLRVPEIYQRLRDTVYPERQENRDPKLRKYWWLFRRSNEQVRAAIAALPRFIATVETSKHRFFTFLAVGTKPEHKLIVIGLDDAYFLGVLSSRAHLVYCSPDAHGALLEDRPVYVKTRCFETFPFPTATEEQQTRIRDLAERLDAHRKRQQAQHPKLTLTDCYNVLEKLRAGTALNAKEQLTHEQGLVTVLRQFHDDLDAAVAEAYGLPPTAADEAILTHLCALNAQRAAEERAGTIRYLRPAFQNPASTATQTTLATPDGGSVPKSTTPVPQSKIPWPKTLAEQAQSVRSALADLIAPARAETLASSFKGANSERIAELLDTLASLGQARALPDGTFIAT